MGDDSLLKQLLEEHAAHFTMTPEGKVKCELNGHMLPARGDALAAFVNGKKFRNLVAKIELEGGLEKYEPFLVPSRNFPRMLYCALTDDLINRSMKEVRQYLKGKKFLKAKERFQQDKQGLHTEIDLLTSDVEEGEEDPEGSDGPGLWLPEEVLREHEMLDAEEEGEGEEEAGGREGAEAAAEAADEEDAEQQPSSMEEDAPEAEQQQQQQHSGKAKRPAGKRKQLQPAAAKPMGKGKQQRQHEAQQQQQNGGGAGKVGKVKPPKAKRAKN